MKISCITRQIRKWLLPLILAISSTYLIREALRYEKEVTKATKFVTSRPVLRPSNAPSSVWILVVTDDTQICLSLASACQECQILLVTKTPLTITHSRCHAVTLIDLLSEEDDGLQFAFGNDTAHLAIVKGLQYLSKFQCDAVQILPMKQHELTLPTHTSSVPLKLKYATKGTGLFPAREHFGCSSETYNADNVESNYKLGKSRQPVIHSPACNSHQLPSEFSQNLNTKTNCVLETATPILETKTYGLTTFETGYFEHGFLWVSGVDLIVAKTDKNSRSLINFGIQKILWYTNRYLSLYKSVVSDYSDYKCSKSDVNTWISLVEAWECEEELASSCFIHFLLYLKGKGYVGDATVRNVQLYFAGLLENDYKFPYIQRTELSNEGNDYDGDEAVYFHGFSRNDTVKASRLNEIYDTTCKSSTKQLLPSLNSGYIKFPDILLVVEFNNPHYEALEYVSLLYQPFFPQMIFCGPSLPDRRKFPELFSKDGRLLYSFVSYGETPEGHAHGAFNYACAMQIMSIQFNVSGYLTISDDTFLLVNNIKALNKNNIWFLPPKELRIGEITKLRECRLGMCDFHPHWSWWELYQKQTIALLNFMDQEQEKSPLIYDCYQQLLRLNGGRYRPSGGFSDVYYIPSRLAPDFAQLALYFLQYEVFLEIAVPTMIRCLEPPGDIVPLQNTVIWDEDRDKPWLYFTKSHLFGRAFFHPTKWGYMKNETLATQYKNLYCNNVIPFLHDRYERLPSKLKTL